MNANKFINKQKINLKLKKLINNKKNTFLNFLNKNIIFS